MKKGSKMSESSKEKMRIAKIGFQHSEETKKKISLNSARNRLGVKLSDEMKERMRQTSLRLGLRPPSRKGISPSPEQRLKQSIKMRGSNSPNWRGGKTKESTNIRHSVQYKLWRESVFKLGDYTCLYCHRRGGRLNAHHWKYSFADFPEYRFELWNGIVLCEDCHKKTPDHLLVRKVSGKEILNSLISTI